MAESENDKPTIYRLITEEIYKIYKSKTVWTDIDFKRLLKYEKVIKKRFNEFALKKIEEVFKQKTGETRDLKSDIIFDDDSEILISDNFQDVLNNLQEIEITDNKKEIETTDNKKEIETTDNTNTINTVIKETASQNSGNIDVEDIVNKVLEKIALSSGQLIFNYYICTLKYVSLKTALPFNLLPMPKYEERDHYNQVIKTYNMAYIFVKSLKDINIIKNYFNDYINDGSTEIKKLDKLPKNMDAFEIN